MTNKFLWSLKNGDLDQIKEYIDLKKYDVNECIDGRLPIHYAALFGQRDVIQYLIEKGADVNAVDEHGITALVMAYCKGHKSCSEVLIDKGANKRGDSPDRKKCYDVADEPEIKHQLTMPKKNLHSYLEERDSGFAVKGHHVIMATVMNGCSLVNTSQDYLPKTEHSVLPMEMLPPVLVVPPSLTSSSSGVSSTTSTDFPNAPLLSGNPVKPFKCSICDKHLASKNVYQLHLRSHSGEKPFECQTCHHSFSQKTSLTRHMRSHTGERPYPCPICEKRFADKERIKIHMRTHTGEKPFQCDICGKQFSQKSTVKRHMSVHTGEKPFKCDHCGKGFANRGNLNAHSKTHVTN